MKFVAILVVLVYAAFAKGDKEMMMKVVETCKQTTGASDDDIVKFMIHTPSENQAQKCLAACFMNEVGIVSELKLF